MKRLIMTFGMCLLAFMLSRGSLGAETRSCAPVWEQVSGQTYNLVAGGNEYLVEFDASVTGPCPQGNVHVFLGDEEIMTCRYMTKSDDIIEIDCGDVSLGFVLFHDALININPQTMVLMRFPDED